MCSANCSCELCVVQTVRANIYRYLSLWDRSIRLFWNDTERNECDRGAAGNEGGIREGVPWLDLDRTRPATGWSGWKLLVLNHRGLIRVALIQSDYPHSIRACALWTLYRTRIEYVLPARCSRYEDHLAISVNGNSDMDLKSKMTSNAEENATEGRTTYVSTYVQFYTRAACMRVRVRAFLRRACVNACRHVCTYTRVPACFVCQAHYTTEGINEIRGYDSEGGSWTHKCQLFSR